MKLRSLISIGLILVGGLVWGQTQAPPSLSPQDRPGIAAGQVYELTLRDALVLLLQNSPDIEASRLDMETAGLNLMAARGVYDPTLSWDAHYQKKATPVSSVLGGASSGRLDETNLSVAPSVSGLFGFGGNWSVSTYGQKQTSDSLFVPLNPQYVAGMTFSFTEPLLRGREIDAARRGIRIASRNKDISVDQFKSKILRAVAQTAKLYFDLMAAQENLEIQRNAYDQAQRSLETNERMASQGLLAQSEIGSARAQVSQYETAWYAAQDQLASIENALKTMLLPSKDSPLWRAWFRPTSTAEAADSRLRAASISPEEAIETALRLRPELSQMKSLLQINEINTRYFTNQTKPQLDLYSSYTGQGLGGVIAPRAVQAALAGFTATVPPQFVGGLSTGYGAALRGDYPTFEAGVRISIPIRNRTAEANLGLAEVDMRRTRSQTNQVEMSIVAEVRNAVQSLRTSQSRLGAAQIGREAAQQDYEGQRRKLAAGLTSVFEMLEKQTRLVDAQARELQAHTDLRKALIELERAEGMTFEIYNIDIDKAAVSSGAKPMLR